MGSSPFLSTPSPPPSAPKEFSHPVFLMKKSGIHSTEQLYKRPSSHHNTCRDNNSVSFMRCRGTVTYSHYLQYTQYTQVWTAVHSHALKVVDRVDCSQSPIFPSDRRDRARLTVNGGHLDFKCTESDLGKSIKSA